MEREHGLNFRCRLGEILVDIDSSISYTNSPAEHNAGREDAKAVKDHNKDVSLSEKTKTNDR